MADIIRITIKNPNNLSTVKEVTENLRSTLDVALLYSRALKFKFLTGEIRLYDSVTNPDAEALKQRGKSTELVDVVFGDGVLCSETEKKIACDTVDNAIAKCTEIFGCTPSGITISSKPYWDYDECVPDRNAYKN